MHIILIRRQIHFLVQKPSEVFIRLIIYCQINLLSEVQWAVVAISDTKPPLVDPVGFGYYRRFFDSVRNRLIYYITLTMNLNYFSYLAELYYCLVFPIMLRFILLILYIMNTMFIKYLIFILMRTQSILYISHLPKYKFLVVQSNFV